MYGKFCHNLKDQCDIRSRPICLYYGLIKSHQTFFPTSNKVDGEVGMVLCLKISTFVKQTPVQDTLQGVFVSPLVLPSKMRLFKSTNWHKYGEK